MTAGATSMAGSAAKAESPTRAAHTFPLDWLPDAEFAALEEALLAVEQKHGLDITSVAGHKDSALHPTIQRGEDDHEDSTNGTQVESRSRECESTTLTTKQDGISHVETDAKVFVVTDRKGGDSPLSAHGTEISAVSAVKATLTSAISKMDASSPLVPSAEDHTSPLEREDESGGDVEDIGKKKGRKGIPLQLHRRWRDLAVTDITASEWCELKVDLSIALGKQTRTPAMKAGSERHAQLEAEVVEEVHIHVATRVERWALRLLDSAMRLRQLLATGLTREVFVMAQVDGLWVVGIIDELRLVPLGQSEAIMVVDTKTRYRPSPPSQAQKRNSRLQVMCYRVLLHVLVTEGLPLRAFCAHFGLNAAERLSPAFLEQLGPLEVGAEGQVGTLRDAAAVLAQTCALLPPIHDTLLLRYEWQKDRSLLGVDEFPHEPDWFSSQVTWHLQYWRGHRPPTPVAEEEDWKCRCCHYAASCAFPLRLKEEEQKVKE